MRVSKGWHPLTAKAVPSPYKQGESAIRTEVVLCTLSTVLYLNKIRAKNITT